MWAQYLHFYAARVPEDTSTATFGRLCGRSDGLFGYVAEADASLVGLAHAVVHPTTWSTRPVCYLEDLFVEPSARGSGVGRALIDAVVAEARVRGAVSVYWHTQEFNAQARRLYDTVGRLRSWVVYEIDTAP